MANLTYSAEDLRDLAEEEVKKGNFEAAIALADNADTTEEETQGEQ